MTLEEKARKYADHAASMMEDKPILEHAYIAGAKENGIVWHDLRKNPDDLPNEPCRYYLNESGQWVFWDGDKWCYSDLIRHPIAWCEIPKFEEDW